MQKTIRLILITSLIGVFSGCSYLKFPGVYKIVIQQGNVITQEMIDKLEPGMTRRQVRFVMGTPLIDDPFASDRWDYFYSYTNQKGKVFTRNVTVIFLDDKLEHLIASDEFNLPPAFGGEPAPEEATEDTEVTTDTQSESEETVDE